jgi:hypothetical protein
MGVFSDFAETLAHSKAKLDGRPEIIPPFWVTSSGLTW